MKCGEAVYADHLIEFRKGPFVTFFRADVVAGSEGMLGVEAHAESIAFFRRIHDFVDLLETISEAGTLTSRDFQRDFHGVATTGFVRFVQRLGDGLDTLRFAGPDMSAGVSDQSRDTENLAAFQLVDECANR